MKCRPETRSLGPAVYAGALAGGPLNKRGVVVELSVPLFPARELLSVFGQRAFLLAREGGPQSPSLLADVVAPIVDFPGGVPIGLE